MSRTGKKPVVMPEKVKAHVLDGKIYVEGPLGKQELDINSYVKVQVNKCEIVITRVDDSQEAREVHGLERALIQNMVSGVSKGFSRVLEIEGVGYRAEVKDQVLNLTLGFSHPINFSIPKGIKVQVEKQTRLTISGSDRKVVGQIAADIRSFRPPEPYKGKGIRYEKEYIQRKVGKAAATAGATK